jgi:hypothetical protein
MLTLLAMMAMAGQIGPVERRQPALGPEKELEFTTAEGEAIKRRAEDKRYRKAMRNLRQK